MVREGPHPPGTADQGRQAWRRCSPSWSPCSAAERPVNDGPTPERARMHPSPTTDRTARLNRHDFCRLCPTHLNPAARARTPRRSMSLPPSDRANTRGNMLDRAERVAQLKTEAQREVELRVD